MSPTKHDDAPKAASSLEARLLLAARKTFQERGFFAANTREIAQRAGTSESGLYRLFPGAGGKYALLMAVYNECWREVNEHIDEHVDFNVENPKTVMLSLAREFLSIYDNMKETATFIIMNTGNTDTLLISRQEYAIISDQNLKHISRVERLAEACFSLGLTGDLTARALSEGVLGVCEGVMLGWYLHDRAAEPYAPKITIDEAVRILSKLLN